MCKNIGINPSIRIDSLNNIQIKKLKQYIDKSLIIEKNLKKIIIKNKQDLIDIKNIRGLRNLKGLPVRGQRTHTNAKTQKKLNYKFGKNDVHKKRYNK